MSRKYFCGTLLTMVTDCYCRHACDPWTPDRDKMLTPGCICLLRGTVAASDAVCPAHGSPESEGESNGK